METESSDRLDRFLTQEGVEDAAYVRGDFFCSRSEEMHAFGERFASRPPRSRGAVRVVQAYLREHPRWRIVFPLDEGPEAAVAIYPGRIFFGPRELDDPALDEPRQPLISIFTLVPSGSSRICFASLPRDRISST